VAVAHRETTTLDGRHRVRRPSALSDERDSVPDPRAPVATLTPHAVMALQRTAGNAAVVSLLARQQAIGPARTPAVAQRVLSGTDPLVDLGRPMARGLLYGTSSTRSKTLGRLGIQDNVRNMDRYRTIDVYNREAGINAVMDGGAATAIFLIREALDASAAAWRTRLTGADANIGTNVDLQAWIAHLKAKKDWHGLRDLAGSTAGSPGAKRVQDTRFGKNLMNKAHTKSTAITPDRISKWLRNSRTYASAQNDLPRKFPTPAEVADLNKWIYSAFFRRTSKAGIDFTIGRGETVHFNISGAPGWNPSMGLAAMKMKKGGLKKVQSDYGRLITASEYKHVKKGIKAKTFPKNQVNFYDEF
jgi:hypothetical protein